MRKEPRARALRTPAAADTADAGHPGRARPGRVTPGANASATAHAARRAAATRASLVIAQRPFRAKLRFDPLTDHERGQIRVRANLLDHLKSFSPGPIAGALGARGAEHRAARDRSGAPCSCLHGRRTERRLVSSVAVAVLVCSRKTAKSSASSTYASTAIGGAYTRMMTTNHL